MKPVLHRKEYLRRIAKIKKPTYLILFGLTPHYILIINYVFMKIRIQYSIRIKSRYMVRKLDTNFSFT